MQKFLLKFVTIKLVLSLLILPQASQASLNAQDVPVYNTGIAQYHHLDAGEKEEIKTNMIKNGGNFTTAAAKFFDEHPLRAPNLSPAVLLQIQQLQTEKARLEAECQRLGQCDQDHLQRIARLTQEIQARDAQLLAAEAAKQRAEAGMARLQGLLSAAQAGEQSARAALLAHKKEIEQLKRAAETLRQQIHGLEGEQRNLQRQLRDAKRTTGDAGKEAVQLESRIQDLVRERQALEAEVTKLDGFLNEIAAVTRTATGGDRAQRKDAIIVGILKLKEEARDALAKSHDLKGQLHQALSDGRTKDQQLQGYVTEIQQLKRRILDLEAQLQAAVQQGGTSDQQAQRVIGQLQAEVTKLDRFLDEIAAATGTATGGDRGKRKDAIIQKIAELKRLVEDSIASSEALQKQVEQLTRQGQEKSGEISSLRSRIEALQKEMQELEAQLRQTGNQAGVSVQQAAEARALIAQLESKNKLLKECLVRLAAAAGVRVNQGVEMQDLTDQIEGAIRGYRRQIAQLHAQNQAEAEKVKDLLSKTATQGQVSTDALRKEQQNIQVLLRQNKELEEALRREQEAAQENLKQLKKSEKKIDELNARDVESEDALRRIQANEAQLRAQIQTLASENDTLKRDIDQLMRLAQAVAAFVGQNARMSINVDALIQGLTKKKQEFDAIARKANAAEEELGRSQHELRVLISRLGAEKDNTKTIQQLYQENTRMAKEVDSLKFALDKMYDDKQAIESEIKRLRQTLQETQLRMRDLQAENDELIESLGKMTDLKQNDDRLRQQIQDQHERIHQLTIEARKLKSALIETEETARYQHLTEMTAEHLSELARLRIRIQSTQDRLKEVIRQGSTVDAQSLSGNITHTQQVLTDMQTLADTAIKKLTPYISNYSAGESLLTPDRGGPGRPGGSPKTPRRLSFRGGSMDQSYDGSWNG